MWEFFNRFIKSGGWRDGWRGFYLSLFMSFYRIASAAKLMELRTLGDRECVREKYRQEAEDVLAEHSFSKV